MNVSANELRLLNEGEAPATMHMADRLEARLSADGTQRTVWLARDEGTPSDLTVAPQNFARARYRLRPADAQWPEHAALSIPAISPQQVVMTEQPYADPGKSTELAAVPEPSPQQIAPPPADRSAGNSFLANFSFYQPIYGVYGPGTDSEARLQISFKYRLFGIGKGGSPEAAREGLYFGYTQRMFWDVGAESSPFRNIDFQPELFYLTPSGTLASGVSISAQAGVSHESNGQDHAGSRSLNTVYIAPMAAIPLGRDYRISLAPRLSLFVGDLSDNPDIKRYRGNTGFYAEIGRDDGLRLSTLTRLNLGSGKGSLNADLSYPLPRIHHSLPAMYLFGQGFVGYGENLLDYNRRMNRFRIGVALVR